MLASCESWPSHRAIAAVAAGDAITCCRNDVSFCRYRFKFQSNLVWNSIKPNQQLCFQFFQQTE
jgi:hypothetical protein